MAHGLFYTDNDYKKKVLSLLEELDPKNRGLIRKYLSFECKYHESVLDDETNAYFLSAHEDFFDLGLDEDTLDLFYIKLNDLFEKHYQLNKIK